MDTSLSRPRPSRRLIVGVVALAAIGIVAFLVSTSSAPAKKKNARELLAAARMIQKRSSSRKLYHPIIKREQALPVDQRFDLGSVLVDRIRATTARPLTKDSIPVLAIGVFVDSYRFLERCLYSIDFPVDNLLIVRQGNDPDVEEQIKKIPSMMLPFQEIHIVEYPEQIGSAGCWNEAMRLFPDAPYWYLVSADVAFTPGVLGYTVSKVYNSESKNRPASFYFVSIGHASIVVSRRFASTIGVFDENFFPSYFADTEIELRANIYEYLNGMDYQDTRKQLLDEKSQPLVLMHNKDWNQPGVFTDMNALYMQGNTATSAAKRKYTLSPSKTDKSDILEQWKKQLDAADNNGYIMKKWNCNDGHSSPDQRVRESACKGPYFLTPFRSPTMQIHQWRLDLWRRHCIRKGNGPCAYKDSLVEPENPSSH